MKHPYRLLAFPISVLVVLSAKGEAFTAISPFTTEREETQEVSVSVEFQEETLTTTVALEPPSTEPQNQPVIKDVALPSDEFWDKLAWCETHQNWQDDGQWAGGLGIYTKSEFPKSDMGTWERWGGEEFAPTPQEATREEQIIVANRIAILGWSREMTRSPEDAERMGVPREWTWHRDGVGFRGWGALHCATNSPIKSPQDPPLFYYEDLDAVLSMSFFVGQEGIEVHDLQGIIGAKQDGQYGPVTHKRHMEYMKKNSLSMAGVPPIE